MASASEAEQYSMDSGSEEEVNDGSETVESDPENGADESESNTEGVESDSEERVESDEEEEEEDHADNDWRKQTLKRFKQLTKTLVLVFFPKDFIVRAKQIQIIKQYCSNIVDFHWLWTNCPLNCFIEFDNEQSRNKALLDLNSVSIGGNRKLVVEVPSWKKLDNWQWPKNPKKLSVKKIPSTSTVSDIKQLFPNAVGIKMDNSACNKKAKATITFSSTDEAEVLRGKTCKLGDNSFKVSYKQSDEYSKMIYIRNIPSTSTVSDFEQLFPNAVDIKLDYSRRDITTMATITFSTTGEAAVAKGKKCKLDFSKLTLSYKQPSKSPNFKGKRKVEEPSSVEQPLSKKEKRSEKAENEHIKKVEPKEKLKNVQKVKKTTSTKDLKKKKGVNNTEINQKRLELKKIKDKKNVKKIAGETGKEKKKIEREKPEKPLKSKKVKVK